MGYNLEVIAPDSENTMIKPHIIQHFKKKYKKVITLFDNDDAGKIAIKKYSSMYKLDGMIFPTAKDISDGMKENGFEYVHNILQPLLKRILNK
jgi:DNA primase